MADSFLKPSFETTGFIVMVMEFLTLSSRVVLLFPYEKVPDYAAHDGLFGLRVRWNANSGRSG